MKCPRCGSMDDRVIDSRIVKDGRATRRRRECADCGKRFTTYEYVETSYPMVAKKDGSREPFDPAKLQKGIARACEKRAISLQEIQDLVDKIVAEICDEYPEEVGTDYIGDCVMSHLQKLDQVAYVRYASVYRQFKDVSQFKEELDRLLKG